MVLVHIPYCIAEHFAGEIVLERLQNKLPCMHGSVVMYIAIWPLALRPTHSLHSIQFTVIV